MDNRLIKQLITELKKPNFIVKGGKLMDKSGNVLFENKTGRNNNGRMINDSKSNSL